MKKLYVLAALMLATSSAHAGNSLSFEINGKKVRIEAPDHCDQLSCIKISAPGLSAADFGIKGSPFGSGLDDVDDAAPRTDTPAPKSTAAPAGQAALPQMPVHPAGAPHLPPPRASRRPPRRRPATGMPHRFRFKIASPRRRRLRLPRCRCRQRPHRLASGRRRKTRERFASSPADRIFADMPSRPARKFSST